MAGGVQRGRESGERAVAAITVGFVEASGPAVIPIGRNDKCGGAGRPTGKASPEKEKSRESNHRQMLTLRARRVFIRRNRE
jgi:hypothetical protein